MKTVCKKLLCLMLVAMMLVSAVPFAFAAEEATCPKGHKSTQFTLKEHVDPTCTATGKDVYFCAYEGEKGNKKGHNATIDIPALDHDFAPGEVTPATCTAGGYTTYECTREGCGATEQRDKTNALNHDWSDWSVTKAATTEAKGEETRTCKRTGCGETDKRDIPMLTPPATEPPATEPPATEPPATEPPATEPPATEPPATEPPATEPPATEAPATTYSLEFYYLDEEGAKVGVEVEVENNDVIPFPSVPDVERKDFLYWVDGTNAPITEGTRWNVGESQKFTAVYKNDTTADDLVTLDVRVAYYVDKEWHHEAKLYTKSFEKSNKNTMFEWLYSDMGKQQARAALEAKGYFGYDWDQVKYYDYFDKGEITQADMKADGDKTVFIKVYSTDEIEANVMLYVHTKKTADVDRVIPMPGYTAGDFVTYADVKAAVKTKYSGSNMTVSDLYTETQWEDLLDDIQSSGSRSIAVEDNGTTEIHVIVKNATSGSNADSSNPKTGDYITVAATTMVLAAAALVSVLELKKRKMI